MRSAPPTPVLEVIRATSYASLPGEVRHQMRRCLLDTVGVAAAGLQHLSALATTGRAPDDVL